MINHTIIIATLTPEDSGQYACGWYYDQQLNQTIYKNVDVSPKKGQIKVCFVLFYEGKLVQVPMILLALVIEHLFFFKNSLLLCRT